MPGFQVTRERIAVLTTKYWHTKGVKLTVGFLDDPPADLRARIISHMNAWSSRLNVNFTETDTDPQVRIAFAPGGRLLVLFGDRHSQHRQVRSDHEPCRVHDGNAGI